MENNMFSKFVKVLIFSTILLFIGSSTSYTQNCIPILGGCDFWHTGSYTFSPTWAPQCSVTVTFQWMQCGNTRLVKFTSLGYPEGTDCAYLASRVYPNGVNQPPDANILEELEEEGLSQWSYACFVEMFGNNQNLMQCDDGHYFYFQTFHTGYCTSWCSGYMFATHGTVFNFVCNPCCEGGCCYVTHKLCYKNGVAIDTPTNSYTGITNCNLCIVPVCDFGIGWHMSPPTPCSVNCNFNQP